MDERFKKEYLTENHRNDFDYDKLTTKEECIQAAKDYGIYTEFDEIDKEYIKQNMDKVFFVFTNEERFRIDTLY